MQVGEGNMPRVRKHSGCFAKMPATMSVIIIDQLAIDQSIQSRLLRGKAVPIQFP
jgi:hypothetical protein